jgi:hypothetical protein
VLGGRLVQLLIEQDRLIIATPDQGRLERATATPLRASPMPRLMLVRPVTD